MKYTISNELPNGSTIQIIMELPEHVKNNLLDNKMNNELEKYLKNPYDYAHRSLNYNDMQQTIFETSSFTEKMAIIEKHVINTFNELDVFEYLKKELDL